jgi:hypothetical protein
MPVKSSLIQSYSPERDGALETLSLLLREAQFASNGKRGTALFLDSDLS